MNQPRYPLRVNIGFLLNQPVGSYRDIHFDYPLLSLSPDFQLANFSGVARYNRTAQGILVDADFGGDIEATCVRCLAECQPRLRSQFQELFAFSREQITDSALLVPEDANIDLGQLTLEYLLIEIPISPLCKTDCAGLCPVCGHDLNQSPCEHVQ